MPIYQTARFQVKREARETCEQAIRDFIAYIQTHEQGTTLFYSSLQQSDDPKCFLHYFAFVDAAAREKHRTSEGTKRFTDILYPSLVEPVEFTEYEMFATT